MGIGKKIAMSAGIAIAILAGLAAIGASLPNPEAPEQLTSEQENQGSQSQAVSSRESFAPRNDTLTIVSGVTEVEAGGYVVYPFTTPKDGINLHLTGKFESPGGIKVFIADKVILDQYKEGKRLFFSGDFYYRTSNDTSREPVESGIIEAGNWSGTGETLYLVLDNTEDPDSMKRVDANLALTYTVYVQE